MKALESKPWLVAACDAAAVAHLAAELKVPEVFAAALVQRGVTTVEAAEKFLRPSFSDFPDPLSLPGIRAAAELICDAIAAERKLLVFGDYDVDGLSATAILLRTFRALGATAESFTPSREHEGYGLSDASIARCRREHPGFDFWVTVDCGISSVDEIAALKASGITVVLTDHHEPHERLPAADALVDPRVAAVPGMEFLCGAGVAFVLAFALKQLAQERGLACPEGLSRQLLPLAGLATVADLVPLEGANRILVRTALEWWKQLVPEVIGLRTLLNKVNSRTDQPDARAFGFQLSPCINAAGRLGDSSAALKLLLTASEDEANSLAAQLSMRNAERKSIENRMFDEALLQLKIDPARGFEGAAAVVSAPETYNPAAREGWHPGVVGIVASRLVERTGVPSAVIAVEAESGAGRGSMRAPAGYNAVAALTAVAEHLDAFGGHAQAAGFSVKAGQLESFARAFSQACADQAAATRAAGQPVGTPVEIERWVAPEEITLELANLMARLEPFGIGNPVPVFGAQDVQITEASPIGAEGKTLALRFSAQGRALPRAIWFGAGEYAEALRRMGPVDIAFEVIRNEFRGDVSPELRIVAIREKA